jgi:hypothetical protein
MIAKARGAAPYGDVAMAQGELADRIGALEAAELKRCRETQRYRDNWMRKVALVLVLMQ